MPRNSSQWPRGSVEMIHSGQRLLHAFTGICEGIHRWQSLDFFGGVFQVAGQDSSISSTSEDRRGVDAIGNSLPEQSSQFKLQLEGRNQSSFFGNSKKGILKSLPRSFLRTGLRGHYFAYPARCLFAVLR